MDKNSKGRYNKILDEAAQKKKMIIELITKANIMDANFWKDRYKDSWDKAAQKEKMIIEQIEQKTGKKVEFYGLGAGSTEYLSGSASANNSVKGDADLYIKDADTFMEVTGPNIRVSPSDALWIRPDKIQNALAKMKQVIGQRHVVIHVIERKDTGGNLIRVIPISEELLGYPTINPRIRGTVETYKEIPATYNKIISFDQFLNSI